jgi:hypothetical protein
MKYLFLCLFREFRDLEERANLLARNLEDSDRKASEGIDLKEAMEQLQEETQALSAEKMLLQDRLEAATADRDRLWEMANQALNGERYAYQTMVNHAVQKNGGGIPFGDAHSLPPAEVRKPQTPGPIGRSSRMLPSEGAARRTNQFVREFVETLNPTPEKAA